MEEQNYNMPRIRSNTLTDTPSIHASSGWVDLNC